MPRYVWAEGTRFRTSAQAVHDVVDEIRQHEGGLCAPQSLVDVGRDDDSPVHGLFEWDDWRAAELYRTDQARHALRSLRVVYEDEDAVIPVPAYLSVTVLDDEGARSGYMPSRDVRSNPELHEQVLLSVTAQLQGMRRRHRSLKELATVWEEVDRIDARTRRRVRSTRPRG